jgi:ATP-dependent DNA ligase
LARALKGPQEVVGEVVKGQAFILPTRRLSPNGFAAWTEVLHRGYEGMVAKDATSPYVKGRTLAWRKVKQKDYRVVEPGVLQAIGHGARRASSHTSASGDDQEVGGRDT